LLSVPVGIPDGVVWLLPAPGDNKIFAIVREDVVVETTLWAYFSSDQIALKCIMRLNLRIRRNAVVAYLSAHVCGTGDC
jgi:hypothetical protein